MPVLLPRREPNHISRPDLFNRSAIPLCPAQAPSNDQSLTQRMRMPRRPSARLKGNARTLYERRIWRLKKWIDPYSPREPVGGTFDRGLRTAAFNLHGYSSMFGCYPINDRSQRATRTPNGNPKPSDSPMHALQSP